MSLFRLLLALFGILAPWSMILEPLTMKQVDTKRIDQLFSYLPETGDVIHRFNGRPIRTLDSHGGYLTMVNGRAYSAHKIAWFLSHGEWPVFQLRHRDGNRRNNRIENLEPVSVKRAKSA